jgi:hypothetical protein
LFLIGRDGTTNPNPALIVIQRIFIEKHFTKNKMKKTGKNSRPPKDLNLPTSLKELPPLKPERKKKKPPKDDPVDCQFCNKTYTRRHLREHIINSVCITIVLFIFF